MKFLIINDLAGMGGSELQIAREVTLLKKNNHDVVYLTLDAGQQEGKLQRNRYNIPVKHGLLYKKRIFRILSEYYPDPVLMRKLLLLINKYKPDVIHVNNISERAVTVYSALEKVTGTRNIRCIQTIRDCRAVCMTGLGVCKDNKLCGGYLNENCLKKCPSGNRFRDKLNDYLYYNLMKKINKLRLAAFDTLISPSEYLKNMCKSNGMSAEVINDVLDNEELYANVNAKDNKTSSDKKVFISYGRLCEMKGTFRLVKAFIKFAEAEDVSNVKLILAGPISDEDEHVLNDMIKGKDYIEYVGIIEHKLIATYLQKAYAVVVPSVVAENYPNTVLEGYASHRIVIGSNRAGTSELISNPEFMFDVDDEMDIVDKLYKVYRLKNDEYERITDSKFKELIKNNSESVYYKNLLTRRLI